MRILYTFLNYNGLTGSELYYYELSREMKLLGHDVSICATSLAGPLFLKSMDIGIDCYYPSEIDFSRFDIIHCSHLPIINGVLKSNIKKPIVATTHSEILDIEKVPNNKKISKIISIRPSVQNINPGSELIFNPIDFSRFNKENISDKGYKIMVGSIDNLRKKMIVHQLSSCEKLVICGRNDLNLNNNLGATVLKECFEVEDLIKNCSSSFGIIKGRTYIESMLCGKPYTDYRVNASGDILRIENIEPSDYLSFSGENFHYSEFDSKKVAKKIEELYNSIV